MGKKKHKKKGEKEPKGKAGGRRRRRFMILAARSTKVRPGEPHYIMDVHVHVIRAEDEADARRVYGRKHAGPVSYENYLGETVEWVHLKILSIRDVTEWKLPLGEDFVDGLLVSDEFEPILGRASPSESPSHESPEDRE